MLSQDTFLGIAKLRLAPTLAGLRLTLFPFDPPPGEIGMTLYLSGTGEFLGMRAR